MKVAIISIGIGVFGTVNIGLLKGQEDLEIRSLVDTIQNPTLLTAVRMPKRVLETWGDLLSIEF